MPSGSKKRKAAKKKNENQQSNNPNPSSAHTHSLGGGDVKHQDDKESDVGEVSSPASQDHHSQHNILTEGEEEEIEKGTVLNLPSIEAKIEVANEHNNVIEGTAVPVEREFMIVDEYDKKNGRFEHDEPARKSYDGGSSGSSSSSSSSSDDESHDIKRSQAVVDIAPVAGSNKVADTSSGEHAEAIESTITEQVSHPIVENVPAVVSEKISSLGEKTEFVVSSPADDLGAPIIESVFKENEQKAHAEDQVGVSEAFKGETSQREEAIIPTVENITQETEDRLNLSYNAPEATAGKGGDADKDSGVTQPLLVPAPHPVRTTSWKSCCGLFEVFTGSGR